MFGKRFSRYRAYYETCPYRDRIDLLAGKLRSLGYAKGHIPEHVHEWLRFIKYCHDRGVDIPTSIYASEVEDYLRQRLPKEYRKNIRTYVRIFIEADDRGNFARYMQARPKPATALFNQWVVPYVQFLREHRGIAEGTLRGTIGTLRGFTEFVDKKGVLDLGSLNATHIHDFCRNPGGRRPETWATHTSRVRCFLKYVFSQQGLQCDLSLAVGGAKHFRYAGLPAVLTGTELDSILGCMDRSNPMGRRDAAMLLLAARYGMRPCDIRRLRFDNIRWREGEITVRQSKTGRPVSLPLLPDVSEALIDYLRAGRPSTSSRYIFVGHKAPFGPLARSLNQVMFKALQRAGLEQRPGPRGLYLLRHTLATRMLGAHVPIKMISDVLGHVWTDTTFGYTKVDVAALRSASLSLREVLP